jgi:hypothetical protein
MGTDKQLTTDTRHTLATANDNEKEGLTGSAGGDIRNYIDPHTDAETPGVLGDSLASKLGAVVVEDILLGTNEVQTVQINALTGTFTLTSGDDETAPIAVGASAAAVQAACRAAWGEGSVDVTRAGSAGSYTYTLVYRGPFSSMDVDEVVVDDTSAVHTKEVQRITVDATSGTWKVKYGAEGTLSSALDFNISAENLKAAIEGLAEWPEGRTVTVTGGPGNAGGTSPYVITADQDGDISQLVSSDVDLSGGGATVTHTTLTQGVAHSNVVETTTEGDGPRGGVSFVYTEVSSDEDYTIEVVVKRGTQSRIVQDVDSPLLITDLDLGGAYTFLFRSVGPGGSVSALTKVTATITS